MITLPTLARKEKRNNLPFLLSIILVISVFSFSQASAQKAFLIEEYLKAEGQENTDFLKTIVFDNVPFLIIKDSNIEIVGEGFPQKITTDINSIAALTSENDVFRTVKLLQVNINSVSEISSLKINLADLKSFSNLSYIFINSQIPLTSAEVEKMVSGNEEGDIVILFQVNSNF